MVPAHKATAAACTTVAAACMRRMCCCLCRHRCAWCAQPCLTKCRSRRARIRRCGPAEEEERGSCAGTRWSRTRCCATITTAALDAQARRARNAMRQRGTTAFDAGVEHVYGLPQSIFPGLHLQMSKSP